MPTVTSSIQTRAHASTQPIMTLVKREAVRLKPLFAGSGASTILLLASAERTRDPKVGRMFKLQRFGVLSAALMGILSLTAPSVSAIEPAEAGNRFTRKVYRVDDLPVWTKDEQFNANFLMHIITTTVTPERWGNRPGSAEIAPYAPSAALVVWAPPETHTGIKLLVDMGRGIEPVPVPSRANAKDSE